MGSKFVSGHAFGNAIRFALGDPFRGWTAGMVHTTTVPGCGLQRLKARRYRCQSGMPEGVQSHDILYMAERCREFRISRPTGYLWLKRYQA